MTLHDSQQLPISGPPSDDRRFLGAGCVAAAIATAACIYTTAIVQSEGWLGFVTRWFAWPAGTLTHLAFTLATAGVAWLCYWMSGRVGGATRGISVVVCIMSIALCLLFVVAMVIAVLLWLFGDSDDAPEHGRRRRPAARNRGRRRRQYSGRRNGYRTRRRR